MNFQLVWVYVTAATWVAIKDIIMRLKMRWGRGVVAQHLPCKWKALVWSIQAIQFFLLCNILYHTLLYYLNVSTKDNSNFHCLKNCNGRKLNKTRQDNILDMYQSKITTAWVPCHMILPVYWTSILESRQSKTL